MNKTICEDAQMPIFKHRKLDQQKDKDRTLYKDRQRFTVGEKRGRSGGDVSEGNFVKNKQDNKKSEYFIAPHGHKEYFFMEILNQLGFNTPKTRLTAAKKGDADSIATQTIIGYIPMHIF